MGTKAILGKGNKENQDFDFGEQGAMPIYFRVTREQVPAENASLMICKTESKEKKEQLKKPDKHKECNKKKKKKNKERS